MEGERKEDGKKEKSRKKQRKQLTSDKPLSHRLYPDSNIGPHTLREVTNACRV